MCSSLRSLSSCTSLESLRGGAPFRLPLWDQASAEFCFARSRDLLTRCPPRLDSSVEFLESSEADETLTASFGAQFKVNEPMSRSLFSEKGDVDFWKIKRHMNDFGSKYKSKEFISNSCSLSNERTVTKSQSTDSASTLDACPSITDLNDSSTLKDLNGYDRSHSLKGMSLSSLNDCSNISGYAITDLNKSSFENVYKSGRSNESFKSSQSREVNEKRNQSYFTNGFEELEKLEEEFRNLETRRGRFQIIDTNHEKSRSVDQIPAASLKIETDCSKELKPLSRFLNKFPEIDNLTTPSFKPVDMNTLNYSPRAASDYSPRATSDYPSLREVSHSPERLAKYTEKYPTENNQVSRFSFKQLERHLDSLDLNKRSLETVSSLDEASQVNKKEELKRTELYSTRPKHYVPQTPVFRRKLSQSKLVESSRRSTKSSPNSPSITSPKVYFRPRTNSLSEEKVRPPPTRRQSYNYSAHYDSSSSDSEFDRPTPLSQGQRRPPRHRLPSPPSSSSSSSTEAYPEYSKHFHSLSSSQVRTKF